MKDNYTLKSLCLTYRSITVTVIFFNGSEALIINTIVLYTLMMFH